MGSTGEATDQDMIAPPSTPDFSGEVDLNLAWLLLVAVVRLTLKTYMLLAGVSIGDPSKSH